jgi:hypothetical protein
MQERCLQRLAVEDVAFGNLEAEGFVRTLGKEIFELGVRGYSLQP